MLVTPGTRGGRRGCVFVNVSYILHERFIHVLVKPGARVGQRRGGDNLSYYMYLSNCHFITYCYAWRACRSTKLFN